MSNEEQLKVEAYRVQFYLEILISVYLLHKEREACWEKALALIEERKKEKAALLEKKQSEKCKVLTLIK
ncbi:MAG: hypothetical protein H0W61_10245 [Bacteroidetes bacterium]|nr:hypothetical protein [Bacteroidota bacterium]